MADGDILGERISGEVVHNGFVTELDVEGLTTGGTYAPGLTGNNEPTAPKIVYTISGPGYDATGALITTERVVYGTTWVRKAYPDNAIADETESSGVPVSWDASPSHDATDPITSAPLLVSYEIRVYDITDAFIGADDVGKPTPVSGVITVSDSALVNGLTTGTYLIRIAALGPNANVSPDQVAVSAPFELTI